MELKDLLVAAVILLIILGATLYIIHARKKGKKCIGCPDGCCSNRGDGSCCTCGCTKKL